MSKKEYFIYKIQVNDIPIYIGRTNNLKRRTYQHNYYCFTKHINKELYNYIRSLNIAIIELEIIFIYNSLIEAKRMECYLILQDYFNNKNLKQKVPNISDR